ncbi:LamG domain-containing protein [Patescibacteria group bacterium]|nr:LamG domain-containing protein [Patescibacteria group bacterium]MBU1868610.1 LamG domain-containing protein [Patescibacteria group bacterium]
MKKILTYILIIGLCSFTLGQTASFFSDTETSVDNTFVAGVWDIPTPETNYALKFDTDGEKFHTNDQQEMFALDEYAPGKSDWTIEAWTYLDGTHPTWLADWVDNGYHTLYFGGALKNENARKLAFRPYGGTEYWSTAVFPTEQWFHLAVTYKATSNELKIWYNGILDATHTISEDLSTTKRSIWISDGDNYNLTGRVDEVRVSSVERYTSNFTPQTDPFITDADTELLLHCNQGTGTVVNDSSGNNRHGTITTGTEWVLRT